MTTKIKGFKVTNAERSRTCGVACKSLEELLTKACHKFEVKRKSVQLYLQDGTLVDDEDYFCTLPAQTCFVLVKKGQQFLTGADIIYNALCAVNVETLKAGLSAGEFINDEVKEKISTLSNLINMPNIGGGSLPDNSHLSSRAEDPTWFQGLDTGAKCKESFMRRRCSDRMRGYLYKAEKDIKLHEDYPRMQHCADRTVAHLKLMLSSKSHMGNYFDRSHQEALCDSKGVFTCDGLWYNKTCERVQDHRINPYANREQRIIFSTWNLDHRIEKSREVIPCLIQACLAQSLNPQSYEVNCDYFFTLLFTSDNLGLVHIVCHDKGAHSSAKCDPDLSLRLKTESTVRGVKRKFSEELQLAAEIKA